SHHLHRWPWKMRTVAVIVRARWDQLDRVAAKDRQVAKVLLPDGQVPGVVRIALGAIAELVSAQRVLGRGRDVQTVVHAYTAALQVKLAQQPPDPEQYPARIVADHEDHRVGLAMLDRHLVTLRPAHTAHRPEILRVGSSKALER